MPHKDPEKARAYSRAYYIRNREKCLARMLARRAENPEKVREWDKRHRQKHRNKRLAHTRAYYRRHRGKILERHLTQHKAAVVSLSDAYIKSLIIYSTTLRFSDIPQSLIALKREELRLKRLLKSQPV